MALFKRSKDGSTGQAPAASWTPHVDLDTARPILLALIDATNSGGRVSNDEIEQLIFQLDRASDTPPTPEELLGRFGAGEFAAVLERPWHWLLANARHANETGDRAFVAIAAYWVFMWGQLQPKFGSYERQFWLVSSVPDSVKADLRSFVPAALAELPPDEVLFGNETGEVTAGFLAGNADVLLT